MTKKFRWGVISTANIARTAVIPAIKESRNGVVLAVASREEAKAQAYTDDLSIERSYGSYEALLADPDIDAIYNPLPNDGHLEWSVAAAKAGKPTLVEKPIGRNADEARQLVEVFQREKLLLAEAFMYRYHIQHTIIKKMVADGLIGPLNLIDTTFTYAIPLSEQINVRLKPELGGGGLLDVGCYCVNACRMYAGQEPEAVTGQVIVGPTHLDDMFVGTLRFPNGILAHFACGMRSMGRNYYTLSGPLGSIRADLAFRPSDRGEATITIDRFDQDTGLKKTETIVTPACNQYTVMVEDFADAVLQGRLQTYDPVDSINNMRVLDALAQAAHEPITVKL